MKAPAALALGQTDGAEALGTVLQAHVQLLRQFRRQPPALPLQLAGVILAAGLIGVLVSLIGGLVNVGLSDSGAWLRYAAVYWITHLLMAGLGAYWLAQAYLERHGLEGYRLPAGLLASYGLTYLLLGLSLIHI